MNKQTHLHLGWPEDEYIFSKISFLEELFKVRCSYEYVDISENVYFASLQGFIFEVM